MAHWSGCQFNSKSKKNPEGLSSTWYIAKKYRNIHTWIADWQWLLQWHYPGKYKIIFMSSIRSLNGSYLAEFHQPMAMRKKMSCLQWHQRQAVSQLIFILWLERDSSLFEPNIKELWNLETIEIESKDNQERRDLVMQMLKNTITTNVEDTKLVGHGEPRTITYLKTKNFCLVNLKHKWKVLRKITTYFSAMMK